MISCLLFDFKISKIFSKYKENICLFYIFDNQYIKFVPLVDNWLGLDYSDPLCLETEHCVQCTSLTTLTPCVTMIGPNQGWPIDRPSGGSKGGNLERV